MRELEQRFPAELVAIGVHSGKYVAERETPRIADAARRLGVHHPVVNDRQFRVWRGYAVRAWPTLVVIDAAGRVVGSHAGEFRKADVAPFLERLLDDARSRGELAPAGTLPVDALGHAAPAPDDGRPLRYPGKVALDGRRIAVADSGHRRVLVGTVDDGGRVMRVEREIAGGGTDGDAAPFGNPQGLLFDGDRLLVADPGTHTVRAVDLASGAVRVVAGTARQLRTRADLDAGALASPWDLARVGRTLFIAMAGIHQLWALDLDEPGARPRPHSGSRAEEIVDGPNPSAALAQPMGLAATADRLWFADAESSAIRWADADPAGRVGTVVGTGLFDFGDRDGRGDDVRLQHPQAVAVAPDGRLLVADSYNDALKWVDPATREARTWLRGFHEPAGLALGDAGRVYVADTNAHRVVVVERDGGMGELAIG